VENRIGFGRRLGAFLIDCILVGILAGFGGATIGGMMGVAAGAAMSGGDEAAKGMAMGGFLGALAGMLIALAVIGLVYNVIEGFTGWTLGKLILGIQVGNENGTRASVQQLLLRYAIKNCNFLLTLLAFATGISALAALGKLGGLIVFVGCFFVLAASKQAFHDMIAKTAVYPRSKLAA
jgi:uncharacterized RDD family membrane protein YckC